jgi:GT2 family glycosyltransferase
MSDLSIVIASWNAKEVLLDCLESIRREVHSRTDEGRIRTETLVVDNGSGDGSAAAVRERHPWAEVIALPGNLGFCAASNVGLRRAKGRHAVLLNNDTIVLPDALERCVRYLDAHPEVGAAGLQLLNPDGSRQNSIHNYPGLLTEIVPKWALETFFPRRYPSKRYHHPEPIEVEAVLGACLFVRREAWESVGLLPEDYFFFLGETDWCLQIARAGWRLVHIPDARVIHVLGASSKKRFPADTRIEYCRSLNHFFRKNRGPVPALLAVMLRVFKTILYLVGGIPGALVSGRSRNRWLRDWTVLRWYARGCPEDEGLSRLREASGEGCGT